MSHEGCNPVNNHRRTSLGAETGQLRAKLDYRLQVMTGEIFLLLKKEEEMKNLINYIFTKEEHRSQSFQFSVSIFKGPLGRSADIRSGRPSSLSEVGSPFVPVFFSVRTKMPDQNWSCFMWFFTDLDFLSGTNKACLRMLTELSWGLCWLLRDQPPPGSAVATRVWVPSWPGRRCSARTPGLLRRLGRRTGEARAPRLPGRAL